MQPLNRCFVTYQEVKSLLSIWYGTRNQKCVHELFGITTKRICLRTAGWTTRAPVQLPAAPQSPSAAQRLHHLQSAEIRESMSILYLIKLVTSRLSSGSPLFWSPWFPSSAGSYMKWVKTNVIPSSSGILISCLSCQHIKFYTSAATSSGAGGGRVSLVTTLNLLNIASLSAPEKTLKGKLNWGQSIKKCN